MCGIVGYVGVVNPELVERLVEESKVRGLHHLGSFKVKGAGIYHTRYCTSGKDHQPITDNKIGLVMNGVIDMGTKKEMESKFKIKMLTDNDAELLFHFPFLDLIQLVPNASIAGIMLSNKKLVAFRNKKRPLWMIEKGKSVLLASTQDIFRRAGAEWKKAKQLEPNRTYSWII